MTPLRPTAARRRRSLLALAAGALALSALTIPAGPAAPAAADEPRPTTPAERATDARLDAARDDPRRLDAFFTGLPKGGDLHNHLSGAADTEYLIQLAAEDGLCIRTADMTAVPPPCGPGTRPAADAGDDEEFRQAIIREWSMQDFPEDRNGHDHFFATFGKFGEVSWRHPGKLLANVADNAAGQHQSYLETMSTPASQSAKRVADEVGWNDDLAALHRELEADGRLDRLVAEGRREADKAFDEFRRTARCGTEDARPGCGLHVRLISQVSRGSSNPRVFTQMALAMRLAERDRRFVAVNLVQPEDWESSLTNYRRQMRMLRYLRTVYPKAHVTLHAGELWPGMVKPEDLRFHIKDAVNVARADRIGHGVDLVHEDDWQRTARTMAQRETAVEINLTSNEQILGVEDDDHPFPVYRAHGVPTVLSTDDPGVSRGDIGDEYERASQTYGLSYPQLKDLSRASLEYAFLRGTSLWRGNPTRDGYRPVAACAGERPGAAAPGPACRKLLRSSEKARMEWRVEAAFHRFEGGTVRGG